MLDLFGNHIVGFPHEAAQFKGLGGSNISWYIKSVVYS